MPSFVKRLLTVSFLVVSAAVGLWAGEIDDYVQAQMQRQHIPGLSLAIVKEGKVILAKGYGFSNVEHNVPAKPETIYQSGSLGKQFTATAVMLLVEEGKLGLDDEITKYLDGTPQAWKGITVRHLLTHTSGIKNYSPEDLNYRQDYSEQELLQKAAALPMDFAAGERWSYSNTGYMLLGMIIRKASGEFYGDYLRKRVFLPLGMETARIISEEDIIPNRAAGYHYINGQLKNQEWVSPSLNSTADGSLYLTVLDLAKWDAALYTEKLLKQSSLEQMWTPVKTTDGKSNPYGFGWFIGESQGHRVIEHSGAWQGFQSYIARFVDDKLTVIVLVNLIESNTRKIVYGVAHRYLPEAVIAEVGEVGENIYDLAKDKDWAKIGEKLTSLKKEAELLNSQVKEAKEAKKQLAKSIEVLEKAVGVKDQQVTMQEANQITLIAANLTEPLHPQIPVDIARLDCYGRELELWSAAKNEAKLMETADALKKTWDKVRPSIMEHGGDAEAKAFDGLMLQLNAAKSPEQYKNVAAPILDEVDNLEKVFAR